MDAAVKRFPMPSVLRYPLLTRGGWYEPRVATGTRVRKGDVLAIGRWSPPVGYLHAATSGVVEMEATAMLLHPDGREDAAPPLSAKDLVERVRDAGIVGLGGAGYPTWLKLRQARNGDVRTLVVNVVECEPGVSADAALLREHAEEVSSGIEALANYIGNSRTIIAVGEGMDVHHDRRLSAPIVFLRGTDPRAPRARPNLPPMEPSPLVADASGGGYSMDGVPGVEVVRVIGPYPSGSERSLLARVLDVDLGKRIPTDVGVVVFNVATVFAVHRAWHCGERLVERVVTVDEENAWLRIGHPVEELPLSEGQVIVGGPVTGWIASEGDAVTKTTRAVTVSRPRAVSPCIRCGWCADACPEGLLPQELFRHTNAGHWSETRGLRLADCVECGACDMACPSGLPLLATFRYGKSEHLEQERRARKAALAKARFTARAARLEQQRVEQQKEREARMASRRKWMYPG